jgi:hypothetical protein
MAKVETQTAVLEESEPATISLLVGTFVEMRGGRWFPCSDLNQKLGRLTVTKIGAVLETVAVEADLGGNPDDVKTFTLRQFYVSGRPTLDFTPESLSKMLMDWTKWLGAQQARNVEAVLRPAVRVFESQYKNYDADLDLLRNAIPVSGG